LFVCRFAVSFSMMFNFMPVLPQTFVEMTKEKKKPSLD